MKATESSGASSRVARILRAADPADLVGLVGAGLVVEAVRELAGGPWAMLVCGVVLTAFYIWREVRLVYRRAPRGRG